jgi:hypothetical protein
VAFLVDLPFAMQRPIMLGDGHGTFSFSMRNTAAR